MLFNSLIAYPTYPQGIQVQWEIDNQQLYGDYKFVVELLTPSGQQLDISSIIYNVNNHRFRNTHLLNFGIYNDILVKCTCTPPRNDPKLGVIPFSQSVSLYHGLDSREYLLALEINRKENLLFERMIGLKVLVRKRKKFGPACSICLDPLTKTVTNSNCPVCFGTSFAGGYYDPVKVWADIIDAPVDKQIMDIGTSENRQAQIRIPNDIMLAKHDILIDEINNSRWDVSAEPTLTKYRSFPVSQQTICTLVAPKSVIYKL